MYVRSQKVSTPKGRTLLSQDPMTPLPCALRLGMVPALHTATSRALCQPLAIPYVMLTPLPTVPVIKFSSTPHLSMLFPARVPSCLTSCV